MGGFNYTTDIQLDSGRQIHNWDFIVLKYDSDGNQLMDFGNGDGVATYDSGVGECIEGMVIDSIDSEDYIYVTGTRLDIVKYDSDGDLVNGFGNINIDDDPDEQDGVLIREGIGATGQAMAVDPEHNIYVAGYTYDPANIVVLKYDSNGNLFDGENRVPAFGTGGEVTYNSPYLYPNSKDRDKAWGIVLDNSEGVLYVAGKSKQDYDGEWNDDIIVLKYDSTTGDPVNGFGEDINGDQIAAEVIYNGGYDDLGSIITLDNSGKIYVVGESESESYNKMTETTTIYWNTITMKIQN